MIRTTTPRLLAAQLPEHVGETVQLAGWLHRHRQLKSISFMIIRDRSGLAQVVVADPEIRIATESVLQIRGVVTANPQAPGGVELTEPEITVLGAAEQSPPFDLYRPTISASLPVLLDEAAAALRHPRLRSTHALSAAAVAGFRTALAGQGFTEIHTPKVVESATESGANVFALDWFGRPAYLAQSPQFYKQMMVGVFERVYETGPVFRAEPHDTARHLAQYTSLDAELGFIEDHQDVMIMVRTVIAGMVAAVACCPPELELLDVELPVVPEEIPQLHFAEAMRMLGKDDIDLAPADERRHRRLGGRNLRQRLRLRHRISDGQAAVLYPSGAGSSGLLQQLRPALPRAELITGGQRLHHYADYLTALAQRGEPLEPYAGYLSAFAHGMPPHGGFALGLETLRRTVDRCRQHPADNSLPA